MNISIKSLALAAALTFAIGAYAAGNQELAAESSGGVSLCHGAGEHCATVKKGGITVKFVKKKGTPDVQL